MTIDLKSYLPSTLRKKIEDVFSAIWGMQLKQTGHFCLATDEIGFKWFKWLIFVSSVSLQIINEIIKSQVQLEMELFNT
jgi:hypothetical protein